VRAAQAAAGVATLATAGIVRARGQLVAHHSPRSSDVRAARPAAARPFPFVPGSSRFCSAWRQHRRDDWLDLPQSQLHIHVRCRRRSSSRGAGDAEQFDQVQCARVRAVTRRCARAVPSVRTAARPHAPGQCDGRSFDDAVTALRPTLATLRCLRLLALDHNARSDGGVRALLPHLAPLTRLTALHLSKCLASRGCKRDLRARLRHSAWLADDAARRGLGLGRGVVANQ
jgi:hypothetical protein